VTDLVDYLRDKLDQQCTCRWADVSTVRDTAANAIAELIATDEPCPSHPNRPLYRRRHRYTGELLPS